jgi:hypothetical protein
MEDSVVDGFSLLNIVSTYLQASKETLQTPKKTFSFFKSKAEDNVVLRVSQ